MTKVKSVRPPRMTQSMRAGSRLKPADSRSTAGEAAMPRPRYSIREKFESFTKRIARVELCVDFEWRGVFLPGTARDFGLLQDLIDLDGRGGGCGGDCIEARPDGAGEVEHTFCAEGIFAEQRDGFAGVAADADAGIDFDFAEDGNAVGLRGFCAFAVAEDVDGLAAVGAGEGAHVFNGAEDLDVNLAKHFDGFANVGEGDGGGRGDDDGAGDRDGLDQSELHVAGAGREIDDEMVELAPLHAAQKLRDHTMQHGTAPDHGLVAGVEQAHGDHFQAGDFHGDDALVHGGERLLRGAEHDGDVGAVDVGVEEAHLVAELYERERKVDRDGGFADAAFAAGDGNEIFYAGDGLAFGHLLRCAWGHLGSYLTSCRDGLRSAGAPAKSRG